MQSTYKNFVDRMITQYEGKYGWDKADPGGPTKYGITCFDLAAHRNQKMDSMTTWAPIVRDMPLSEAEEIYRTKYARAVRYDDLPPGVDCCMFDYAVNSGPTRVIHAVRIVVNVPGGDGVDISLLNAIKKADPKQLIEDLCQERLNFMHHARGGTLWPKFGKGWQARVDDLKAYALKLAVPDPVTESTSYVEKIQKIFSRL